MSFFSKKKENNLSVDQNNCELESKLLNLSLKKFHLYTQLSMGQLKQTSILKKTRRELARVRFYLNQK